MGNELQLTITYYPLPKAQNFVPHPYGKCYKLLKSLKNGATRIRDLVKNLRTFSRLDETGTKAVNLHENLEATLSLLQHRLHPTEVEGESRNIEIEVTTKPVGSGTGLGLSVSYSIVVEYHGGQLSCISAPGEGTEFIIEIPNN